MYRELISSRIKISNLPQNVTIERLKNIFEEYGRVTDICLVKNSNKFRRFGFIGFYKVKDSINVVKNMQKHFIDSSLIKVKNS